MKKLLFVIVSYFLIMPAFAATVDRIIAKVGSDVITLSDVAQAVDEQRNYLFEKYGQKKGVVEFEKFKQNALEELILQKILKSQIIKEGIQVSDKDVDQEFQIRLNQYNLTEEQLISKLKKENLTIVEYKNSIRRELEKQQFVQKKIMPQIAISEYDLQKEYEKNKDKFKVFNKLSFIEVFLTADKFSSPDEMSKIANQIHEQLNRGQSAAELIKKYSSGAFAKNGGASGEVEASQLRPEIQALLSKLQVGQTSQLFPIQQGVFIFKLISKSDPKPLPFNLVSNQLRSMYGEKALQNELHKYLMAVKEQTYVEIIR